MYRKVKEKFLGSRAAFGATDRRTRKGSAVTADSIRPTPDRGAVGAAQNALDER
jgi:hypothetical protein